MNIFKTHSQIISEYKEYLKGFINIADDRISDLVENDLLSNKILPEPLIQFNPAFDTSESLNDLVAKGEINDDLPAIFGTYQLYYHQIKALKLGISGKGFIVTSGTGSGKSLTYLATIFNAILNLKDKKSGVKAILVYPMNALINSQEEEIKKYEINYLEEKSSKKLSQELRSKMSLDEILEWLKSKTEVRFPINYSKYTGQEGLEKRKLIQEDPPDIILTNYMMLELIMTRHQEEWLRMSLSKNLQHLVFDELHTYRGRQGSDVSMLIRRIKNLAKQSVVVIGTSATMASEGTKSQKTEAIQKVAKTIFDEVFDANQIIGETLRYCTNGLNPANDEIEKAINDGINLELDEVAFVKHPLSNWLESNVAVMLEEGRLVRGKPITLSEISLLFSNQFGVEVSKAKNTIQELLEWAESINVKNAKHNIRNSYLPFRFHQFISQTTTVFLSLESQENRIITIDESRFAKDEDQKDFYLYPTLFSRYSGVEFICVEKDLATDKFKPRNPDEAIKSTTQKDVKKREVNEKDFSFGYVVYDEGGEYWTEDDMEFLPETWFETKKGVRRLKSFYEWQLPERISFNKQGYYSSNEDKYPNKGWFLSAKLRVDITAGVVYEDVKTSENTKLMRLGNEGRSTATTIKAYSIINALHTQKVEAKDQKLLSFTDNRQDASLQAGHFNDFLSTVRVRSAIYHVLQEHGNGLEIRELPDLVRKELDLDFLEYAKDNTGGRKGFGKEDNALSEYLFVRLVYDLKRGWRYTLPNLEQTGLVSIEYQNLEKFCQLDDFEKLGELWKLSVDERQHFIKNILNFFRTSYAVYHRKLVDENRKTEDFIKDNLDTAKLWSLDIEERIELPSFLVAASPGKIRQYGLHTGSMGYRSNLGRYVKRFFREREFGDLRPDDYRELIETICDLLVDTSFLAKNEIVGDKGTVKGYQLRLDNLLWYPSDGKNVASDEVRVRTYKKEMLTPNTFFQNLYKRNFKQYHKAIIGREHTGQLSTADRVEREELFRQGKISSLFCSPTMELGIDIANLNIVHMRNVPPNPANYAQRSGRAGRSGQTALVITYCSARSPHDRNYFKHAEKMVAGSVVPPRIDLLNEELIKSHFNASILMELGVQELNKSVHEILDSNDLIKLPIRDEIRESINLNLKKYQLDFIDSFKNALGGLLVDIEKCKWFNSNWFYNHVNSFYKFFDTAFDRWRTLYKSAEDLKVSARAVIDNAHIKYSSPEHKQARAQHAGALKQISLLKNESNSNFGNQSEFYIFRYLASEGFLPGYNFTRLPVRSFVGSARHKDQGEYISRPRFVALKEFGPNNLIYHNGSKYRIYRRMQVGLETSLEKLIVSNDTGYVFQGKEAATHTNDPITGASLKSTSSITAFTNSIELAESEGRPQARISCEEEDRMSTGFEFQDAFRYVGGLDNTESAVIKAGDQPLLNLIYGPATELFKINKKWRRNTDDGFDIDKENGKWLKKADVENNPNALNVRIFARETADTLYIQPLGQLELDDIQTKSLCFALKRGIENMFQAEENEIGVAELGEGETKNILLYESAEGSLGIMSQLVGEPEALKTLFIEAYKALHFDPETKLDTKPEIPKASYDDLLSYYNQRFHDDLDRHSIKKVLEELMDFTVEKTSVSGKSRGQQLQFLYKAYDKSSSTELKFLKYLDKEGLALPEKAQVNLEEYYISADFVYELKHGQVFVFVDGSVHDDDDQKRSDKEKRDLLENAGYDIIVWHYLEPLDELVRRRSDVFKKVI